MKNIFILVISFVLMSVFATAQNKTIIIMQDNTGLSSQSWFYSGSANSLQTEEIKKYWNEDKYITAAAYTSNGWFVLWLRERNGLANITIPILNGQTHGYMKR